MKRKKPVLFLMMSLLTISTTPVTALARSHGNMENQRGTHTEKHSATHHRDTATESQNNSEQATPEEHRYHRQNAMNHMGSEPSVGTSNYDTTEGNATVQMTPINTNTQQTTCQYQASCEYRTEESGTQHRHNWTKQAFDYYSRCLPTV